MKQKRYYLAFLVTMAILSSSLLTNLANCDEALVNSTVTLGPEYADSSRTWWVYELAGGTTISIDVSVQSGTHVDFYIKRGTNGERVYERNDLTNLQDTWVVPDTGNYMCNIDNSGYGYQTSEVSVLIQKTAAGGGFDPLPIAVVAIVVVIVLLSVLLVIRMRKPPPPPPDTGELPPPPP